MINEGYAPFPTFPQRKHILKVVLSEAKDLPILERGFHPLSNFSPKAKMILIPSHLERSERSPQLSFLGGVRGGQSPPLLKGGDLSEKHFGVTTIASFRTK